MSESAVPDPRLVDEELAALESGVGRLIAELESLRSRTERAEAEHRRFEETLRRSAVDAGDPASLERRLRELTEENSRLREVIREARERADRIRGRLIVMEDESIP